MDRSDHRATPADALVVFGATGDLAHKSCWAARTLRPEAFSTLPSRHLADIIRRAQTTAAEPAQHP